MIAEEQILIMGEPNSLTLEFARLAIAAGLEPIWFDAKPPEEFEPWHAGVNWGPPDSGQEFDVIVCFEEITPSLALLGRSPQRLLSVSQASVVLPEDFDSEWIRLETGPTVEEGEGLRVETVAMAALRCALEPERAGRYDREQIAYIGDAMMLQ